MELKTKVRKGAIEFLPKGKLDINQAEKFEENFNGFLKDINDATIGVNLAKIEYIDSSGLGVLIKILNSSKNDGKSMLLFGASPKIQNIFQLARLEKFFTFVSPVEFNSKYPDAEDEALDSFIDSL